MVSQTYEIKTVMHGSDISAMYWLNSPTEFSVCAILPNIKAGNKIKLNE